MRLPVQRISFNFALVFIVCRLYEGDGQVDDNNADDDAAAKTAMMTRRNRQLNYSSKAPNVT